MGGITSLLLLLLVAVTVSTLVDLQKRIIGGRDCTRPYHVKLTDENDNLMCGGSLISDQWILTAAHCKKATKAVLAEHPGPVPIKAPPVIYKDKDKNKKDRTHDIMLLKIPAQTDFDHIELPDCENHPTPSPNIDVTVQIGGYGATAPGPKNIKLHVPTKDLQCADIKVVDCLWHNPLQKDHPEAHQYMFCGYSSGVDTCPGDSGGGVVYKNKIYGVHSTSGVDACTKPAAFMKVCDYMKWIKKTITKTVVDKMKGCLGCGSL